MNLRRAHLRCCVFALTIALPGVAVEAQAARDSVLATVQEFFRSMEANDAAAAARILTSDGFSYATRKHGDSVTVRSRSFQSHLDRLRAAGDVVLERMWNPVVQVHETIGMVWTPYDLYVNGTFSHCGIDVFTLVQEREGWKISSVSYTVEPTGCAPSPLGPPKR